MDEEAMNQQKGVLKDVVKALAKNFLKGRGISHMSLPVRMFEPKSTTQRVVDIFSFGPVYLKKAAKLDDPLERFKHVIAVSIAGMHLCIGQLKPFNPILGETIEAHFVDGCRIYAEHTSHHPPITNYLLEDVDDTYRFYGSAEMTASLGANSLKAG